MELKGKKWIFPKPQGSNSLSKYSCIWLMFSLHFINTRALNVIQMIKENHMYNINGQSLLEGSESHSSLAVHFI